MSVSQSEQTRSNEFVQCLHTLCGVIDSWAPHIPEGEYLESMNTLKELFEFKGDMERLCVSHMTNPVIQEHVARTEMSIRPEKRHQSNADKLATGLYSCCRKCDRVVINVGMKKHLTTQVCWKVFRSKKLTHTIKKRNTSEYEAIITRISCALFEHPKRGNWGFGGEDEAWDAVCAQEEEVLEEEEEEEVLEEEEEEDAQFIADEIVLMEGEDTNITTEMIFKMWAKNDEIGSGLEKLSNRNLRERCKALKLKPPGGLSKLNKTELLRLIWNTEFQ